MYCRICGNSLKETDTKCDVCGAPVVARKSSVTEEEVVYNTDKGVGRSASVDARAEVKAEIKGEIKEERPTVSRPAGAPVWGADNGKEAGEKEISVVWRPEEPKRFAFSDKSDINFKFSSKPVEKPAEPEFNWDVHDFSKADKPVEPEEFVWDMEAHKPDLTSGMSCVEKEPSREIDKFFTFSQKSAEFQKLLDREYEKIQRNARPEIPMPGGFAAEEMDKTAKYDKGEIQKEIDALIEATAKQDKHDEEMADLDFSLESLEVPVEMEIAGKAAADAGTTDKAFAEAVEAEAETTAIVEEESAAAENTEIEEKAMDAETAGSAATADIEGSAETEAIEEAAAEAEINKADEAAAETAAVEIEEAAEKAAIDGSAEIEATIEEPESRSIGPAEKEPVATESVVSESAAAESETAATAAIDSADRVAGAAAIAGAAGIAAGAATGAAAENAADAERSAGQAEAAEPKGRESRQAAEMAAARNEFFGADAGKEASEAEDEYGEEDEEDEEDEDEYKNWGFGKTAAAVIVVIIILELAMLGIKYFLPNSEAADVIGAFQKNLTAGIGQLYERVSGGGEPADTEEPAGTEEPADTEKPADTEEPEGTAPDPAPMADKDALVASQLALNKNIVEVKASSTIGFDASKSYSDPNIAKSQPITNNILYAPEQAGDGDAVYYDREIVAALIRFDSMWIDYVNSGDKSVYTAVKEGSQAYKNVRNFSKAGKVKEKFLLLEIGELRQSGDDYYAWVHEKIEVTEAGKAAVKEYNWIYRLEKSGRDMLITNYYRN